MLSWTPFNLYLNFEEDAMQRYSRRNFMQKSIFALGASWGLARALRAQNTIEGEEWRAMDDGARGYDPDRDSHVVRNARESIKKNRQADVEIRLLDRDGEPVRNQTVSIEQQKNAFPFGDNLWQLDRMYRFNEHNTDKGFYWRHRFKNVLNAANALCYWTERPRNDGSKTEDIQGRQQLDGFRYCVDWANSQGLMAKGHPLFWSIPKCWPQWLNRYDLETQMKFAEIRVRDIVARFRGRIKMYDAVNESMWEPAPKNLPNRHWPHIEPISDIADYVHKVLGWARDEDPDAKYLINDYGLAQDPQSGPRIDKDGNKITARSQRQRYIALVRELADRDASPDAMGLQCHVGGWQAPADQLEFLDEMATAGIPLHVTEFWANTKDLRLDENMPQDEVNDLQATFIENYLTVAFGHPAVDAFFFWGLMGDAIDWGEHSSHRLKPLYTRVEKLLKETWMTHETLQTDNDGVLRFRGFYGDYALRYPINDATETGIRFCVSQQSVNQFTLTANLL